MRKNGLFSASCFTDGHEAESTFGKDYESLRSEIKMKRLESPPSGHFMFVARVPVPVAPLTIRRHIVSETKPML